MKESFVLIDENKIRYLESGNGDKVIILIHGLGASAERWEFVVPTFEKYYKIIAPDIIGFGQSDKPLVDYTPEFFSDFLEKFFKKLGIQKCILVGSSLGGQIAADFVSQNNHLVEKLVLVSPAGIMKESTPALDAYIMAALYPNEDTAKNAFEAMGGKTKKVTTSIIQGFVERMQLPNAKMAFMSTLLGLKNAEVITEKLKKITVPTLIIWGAFDPVIPADYADDFGQAIPNSKVIKLNNCGHTPYVEKPNEFSEHVLEFLNSK